MPKIGTCQPAPFERSNPFQPYISKRDNVRYYAQKGTFVNPYLIIGMSIPTKLVIPNLESS